MKYRALNEDQKRLCRECGIEPEGYAVSLENEYMLCLLHLKTRNEVTVHKSERERRLHNGGY